MATDVLKVTVPEELELKATVERLRKDAHDFASESYTGGKTAGAKWAKEDADHAELRRLNIFFEQDGGIIGNTLDGDASATEIAEAARWPDSGRDVVLGFWADAGFDSEESLQYDLSSYFAKGFLDGAVEVWRAVWPGQPGCWPGCWR